LRIRKATHRTMPGFLCHFALLAVPITSLILHYA
jgi:hypothetical protein